MAQPLPTPSDLTPNVRRGWIGRAVSWIGATHLRAAIALVLFALIAFVPGQAGLQPMDRDEPRFAQATKQMLESGDFVDIRFQDEARHKKPVGIYWLQSVSVALGDALGVEDARRQIWLYRIPSLLGALAMVLATYWAALGFVGRQAAFLAGLMMAACLVLGVEARLAKTDAVLAACCTLVLGGLARAYLGRAISPFERWGMWSATALAILVKGPILLMIAGLALLVLGVRDRSLAWFGRLRPLGGLLLVVLVVAPWLGAILYKSGGAFLTEAVGNDMLGKVASGQENHGAPPGFYFIAFFATFWPAAALAGIAAPFVWQTRREPATAFLLAWTLPSWLVFELVPTKLPHYVLPLYPAIAILIATTLVTGGFQARRRTDNAGALLIVLIPLVLLVGLSLAARHLDGTLPYTGLPFLLLALGLSVLAWLAFRRADVVRTIVIGAFSSLVVSVGVFGFTQEFFGSLKVSPRLAAAAESVACEDKRLATAGYREPSLVFLTRTDLTMTDGQGAARFLGEGGCRIAFVTDREEAAFLQAAESLEPRPRLVTRVPGFNINGGRKLDIGVYATQR